MLKILDIYTDGSFNGQNSSWAFMVIEDNKPIFQDKGILLGEINKMWQIGGEIKAAENAVLWATKNDCKININYDYSGVEFWATGKWRTKNEHTKAYAAFMKENSKYINKYIKVKSHSGVQWNEACDSLAKI